MSTTTDLRFFGFRELKMAAELLQAYCDNPPDFMRDGVHLMMNTQSGYVFLTDEDFNVAMMNGEVLAQFHNCPECRAEGFSEDLPDDVCCQQYLKEALS